MLITKLFKHKQVHVENKICKKAVDGTHLVRNLIGDVQLGTGGYVGR